MVKRCALPEVCKTYQTFLEGLLAEGATVYEPTESGSHLTLEVNNHRVHCYFYETQIGLYTLYQVTVRGIEGISRSVSYSLGEANARHQAAKVVSRIGLLRERQSSRKGARNLSKKYAKKIEQHTGLTGVRVGVSVDGHRIRCVTFGPDILKRLGVDLESPKKVKNPPSLWEHLDADLE